jgi:hypothetical protein
MDAGGLDNLIHIALPSCELRVAKKKDFIFEDSLAIYH